MLHLFGMGLFFSLTLIGIYWFKWQQSRANNNRSLYNLVLNDICDMVTTNFYLQSKQLFAWSKMCYNKAEQVDVNWTKHEFVINVQAILEVLRISHLTINEPADSAYIWHGESLETGIRTRNIEGYLVITKIIPNSAAAKNNLKLGDIILKLNDIEAIDPSLITDFSGTLTVKRGNHIFTVNLNPAPVVWDSKIELFWPQPQVAVITIPSFRGELFTQPNWNNLIKQFSLAKHLIIDLRDNNGGDFVAMLRALSPFFCTEFHFGNLKMPRYPANESLTFIDDLNLDKQLAILATHNPIALKTFPNYPCFTSHVTVLVDFGTSSVAEIFTDAMLLRAKTFVWGAPTSGSVLLSIWHKLPMLGEGYTLAIPEAIYLTHDDKILEGEGIYPQQILYYKLAEAILGQDSWLLRAIESQEIH